MQLMTSQPQPTDITTEISNDDVAKIWVIVITDNFLCSLEHISLLHTNKQQALISSTLAMIKYTSNYRDDRVQQQETEAVSPILRPRDL